MKQVLVVIAIFVFGLALRNTKQKWLRKLGVLTYIAATSIAGYFITGSIIVATTCCVTWFLIPWLELLFSVKNMKLPLHNRLRRQQLDCKHYFPEAPHLRKCILDKGYKHLSDCGWDWGSAHEHYSFYWHPEQKHLAAICHRIQSCMTFSYINIYSAHKNGTLWKSSNFPFSNSLSISPEVKFNHITSGNVACPEQMIYAHELFLYEAGISSEELKTDPQENVENFAETEMLGQINYNLKKGIIEVIDESHFSYSLKGLFFLWKQTLKDMFRIC